MDTASGLQIQKFGELVELLSNRGIQLGVRRSAHFEHHVIYEKLAGKAALFFVVRDIFFRRQVRVAVAAKFIWKWIWTDGKATSTRTRKLQNVGSFLPDFSGPTERA